MTALFGLRKTWIDPGPGIALVQIHYTCAPRGTPPDWSSAEQVVLAPSGPSTRSAVLEVPRDDTLSLHHFFFVVGAADRAATGVFTEDITARELVYSDDAGAYTSVGFAWNADGLPNYTSGVMDGLPFSASGDSPEAGDIYEFVRAQPLPHVFRGRVWGVRGSTIRYAFHLIRHGLPDPAGNTETWDDNGWTVAL